ncbi:MAG: fibronectin type III domain-containing protein, partial [Gemmatimonadetes bacterium]|nr:fibronectin type III domain-containing protein [Gemmatimonadota bacterium]
SGATGQTVRLATGGSEVDGQQVDGTASSAEFRGLQAGLEYQATVTASNAAGSSPAANQTFTLPATPAFDNMLADPGFADEAFSIGTRASPPDFTLASMPTGYTAFDVSTISDGIVEGALSLEATSYAGAVAPGTAPGDAWYDGWTVWTVGGSDSRDGLSGAKPQVVVTNDIMADATWTSGNVYVLDGIVFVGDDCGQDGGVDDPGNCSGTSVTLTIEPGTTIVGRLSADITTGERASELVISRGSRIIADATGGDGQPPTEAETIVFTSARDPGSRARGDWGGLVINGQAPINSGDEAQGEGDSGLYGGTDPMDDSGILRGVRVEFAGDNFTEDDQLNGIALQGVGAGTTIDYVQVHYNQDDGIEPFGGTVG